MTKRSFSMLAALALVAASTFAAAQNSQTSVPRYVTLPAKPGPLAPVSLQTWGGTFTYQGSTNHFTMVGTDPSTTNTTTNVAVYIIPLRMAYNVNGVKTIFDPNKKLSSTGNTVTAMVRNSPILQNVSWVQGGTNLGTTQYIDAYQRGNFWTNVMTNTNYHVLLSPVTVLPAVTLQVPAADGTVTTEFGVKVGTADINWFDNQINTVIRNNPQITPAAFPIFLTYDTYLTEGICCIGGYHSITGSQTYAHATYIDSPTFAQDISALSHEVGEWYDDPLISNTQGACGGILENGDPLENLSNFGTFPVTFKGITWHPQDLVFLKYFGQTPSTSVNDWWTFNNNPSVTRVCQYGQ